jgi:hypothetical protein
VVSRRRDDRVEIGDVAGAHLHGAERDDVGAGVDRLGDVRRRHRRNRDVALLLLDEKRK